MGSESKLTNEELLDLRTKLDKLAILFKEDRKEFTSFKQGPISYLRNLNIKAFNRIRNFEHNRLLSHLSSNLKFIIKKMAFFNECSWCKIVALITIYSVFGAANSAISFIRNLIGDIIEAIEGVLNLTNEIVESLMSYLNRLNENLSPYRLANIICERLGYCPI